MGPDRGGGGSGGTGQDEGAAPRPSVWEWVVAACGLVLVAGAIGYMVHHALTAGELVPEVTVERAGIHPTRGGYVVRFAARNHGNATVASLLIEGELRQGSSIVETSEATLDYVPSFSERRGGLFFQQDPNRHELRLVAKGYREP